MAADDANNTVEFIDGATGFHGQMRFRNFDAAEQPRIPAVTCFGIYFHGNVPDGWMFAALKRIAENGESQVVWFFDLSK